MPKNLQPGDRVMWTAEWNELYLNVTGTVVAKTSEVYALYRAKLWCTSNPPHILLPEVVAVQWDDPKVAAVSFTNPMLVHEDHLVQIEDIQVKVN